MRLDPIGSFLIFSSLLCLFGRAVYLVDVLIDEVELSVVPVVLDSLLQLDHLVLEQFVQELAQLVKGHFTRLLVSQDLEDVLVAVYEGRVDLTWNLVSSEHVSDEGFNHANLQDTRIVRVNSIVDVLGHLLELLQVDKQVSQVLDGLEVVGVDHVFSSPKLLVLGLMVFLFLSCHLFIQIL